jgi:hypothetical protein
MALAKAGVSSAELVIPRAGGPKQQGKNQQWDTK